MNNNIDLNMFLFWFLCIWLVNIDSAKDTIKTTTAKETIEWLHMVDAVDDWLE